MTKNKSSKIIIILTILFYITISIIINKIPIKNNELELFLIIGLVTIIFSQYAQIIIHETGHLIFGLLSGYKLVSFRIGKIILLKIDNKIKVKKFNLTGTLGQCLMEPPKLINNRMPVMLYNYGGVIMNFIISIILIVISNQLINSIIIKYILETFAVTGIYYALTNGIPLETNTINNDGLNAMILIKNKDAQKAFWIQLMANAELTKGKRPKDLPKEWFYLPNEKEMTNNITATIGILYCDRLLDEHKFKKANKVITKLLENESNIVGIHKHLIIANKIYCELLENNIEKATALLTESQKKFMKAMKDFPSIIRTEYAIEAIINKDYEKSSKILEIFEKQKETYPYKADIEAEEELINIIKNKEKSG